MGATVTTPGFDARFDTSPEEALPEVQNFRGPIVVDLDETLLLTNSTSLFLDSVRPAFLVYFIVKLADLLRPRGQKRAVRDQDTRRVRAVLRFIPWSRTRWQRRAAQLIPPLLNQPLIDALKAGDRPVIVSTKGFGPVVEPIIELAGLGDVSVVSMDPNSVENRDEAKFRLTTEAVAPLALDRCMVVTDSMADEQLLSASARPMRVEWPLAEVDGLFASLYLPGRYLGVKRPDGRYLRTIAREDFAFWILGSVFLASRPVTHVAGLFVLAISFWAVYEFGYLDNDRSAEHFEHDPVLSDEYHVRDVRFRGWKPVAWSVAAGVAGLWILRWPNAPSNFDYVRWAGVLGATWAVFIVFNRVDKQTRVLLYPVLQLARLGAFLAVVGTTAIADMALIIIALLRSLAYFIYRTRGERWPSDDVTVLRLIVFAAGIFFLASQHDWSDLYAPTTVSLLAWMTFLARHELPKAIARAHRIDRHR